MSENTEKTTVNAESENKKEVAENTCEKYSIAYALDMIERIATDNQHIYQAISAIGSLENEGTPCGGSAEALAKAAADVVRCRETTAQKLIDFYGKMVDDLKKVQVGDENEAKMRKQFLDFVHATTVGADAGSILPDFANIWKTVFLSK